MLIFADTTTATSKPTATFCAVYRSAEWARIYISDIEADFCIFLQFGTLGTFKRTLKTELFDIAYSEREHSAYSLCHYATQIRLLRMTLYKKINVFLILIFDLILQESITSIRTSNQLFIVSPPIVLTTTTTTLQIILINV